MILLDSGLDSMLQLRSEKEVASTFKQMDNRLEFLLKHSEDRRYFHSILKRLFSKAMESSNPTKAIEKSISLLKKRFPDCFRFIVWGKNGEIQESLTDEIRYKYIVKSIYKMFREVATHCKVSYPGSPETLSLVTDKINLFRGYLGRFLVPNHLRLPYQAGIQGECILADTNDRFPLFWFHSESELTLFCSISGDALNKNSGLKHAVENLNRGDRIISGIVSDNGIFPPIDQDTARELMIELGKFENASLPHRTTAKRVMAFKLLTPNIKGFCFSQKKSLRTGFPEEMKRDLFSKLIMAMGIILYVLFCYSLRVKKISFSIRLKLALLFIYANGLPLMILGTIGYEYLQQQRFNLIQEVHSSNEKVLLEVDSGYGRHRKSLSHKTEKHLKSFRKAAAEKLPEPSMLPMLNPIFEELGADEVHVFDKNGSALISYRKRKKPAAQTFLKMYSACALIFANQKVDEPFEQLLETSGSAMAVAGKTVISRGTAVMQTLLSKLNKLENFIFGSQAKLCYATLLGDKNNQNLHSMMLLIWQEEEAQANYAYSLVKGFNRGREEPLLGVSFLFNGLIKCPGLRNKDRLMPILQKAAFLQSAFEDNLDINGTKYIATAIGGKELQNLSLVAITPLSKIDAKIASLKNQLAIFIIISLTISTGVALSLSSQFLEPVKQLSEAVIQIGKRNFRYQTNITSNDEFGDLGKVFNSSIQELEELEIGRVVQENLFPGNRFAGKDVTIFAKTVTMTKLGGDYYDFFKLNELLTGVFMGDVAGHGIPAALIMAMGKASVLMRTEELNSPEQLLTSIHKMLFSLKSRTFKKMMTCQYMTLNSKTGLLTIANAGHCYPVIVAKDGKQAEYVEIIGSPVGIARRAKYKNIEVQLNPGDTVVLYSDGMLEASNEKDGAFGIARFLELTKEAWHENLEIYYQHMFDINKNWAEKPEDDLTIVLLRYHMQEKST